MVIVVIVVVIVAAMCASIVWGVVSSPVVATPSDIFDTRERWGAPETPASVALIGTYLDRHMQRRRIGALFGVLTSVYINYLRTGGIQLGIGYAYFPDLVASVLSGVLIAVVLSESHHLRRSAPSTTTIAASLEPRDVASYRAGLPTRSLRVATAISVVIGLGSIGTAAQAASLLFGVVSAIVLAAVEFEQRYIAVRPRPAMADDMRSADDAIRSASCHALSRAGRGLVLVLIGFQFGALAASKSSSSGLLAWVSIALLIAAIVDWRASRVWVKRSP